MSTSRLWKRFQQHLCRVPDLGLTLDVNRMRFGDDYLERMTPPLRSAFEPMDALERGAVANPDEKRMRPATTCSARARPCSRTTASP